MRKVEIGCGQKKREGYECCDVRKIDGVDHVCEANKLPFEDGTIDEIYSRHLIEHLTLKEFIEVLAEWNRVLKYDGEVYIICPNLLWHLNQILSGDHASLYNKQPGMNDRYWGFGSLFGWQQDKYDVHKFGYYYELLRDILEYAGFYSIEDLTDAENGLEHAPHHLEIKAKKNSGFTDPTKHKLYRHFDVTH